MNNLRQLLPALSSLLPFEATARHGSITKAAEELGLTQAAISKQIKQLEENLGVQLFERRNRAIYLNQNGREFQQVVSSAMTSIGVAAQDLRQQSESGEVVLRSQLCEGLYWLMPRLSGFYQKHPDIPVRVTVSTKPLRQAEERFDLAIQTTGRDQGSNVQVFTASDEVFPVCSPKYLAGLGKQPKMTELWAHQLLHHKVDPQDWISWDMWLEQMNVDLQVGYSGTVYDSYPMMVQAVLEGHGIALAWRRTMEPYLNSGAVVQPFDGHLYLPDGLSIYKPSNWKMRAGTSQLLDWLKRELS